MDPSSFRDRRVTLTPAKQPHALPAQDANGQRADTQREGMRAVKDKGRPPTMAPPSSPAPSPTAGAAPQVVAPCLGTGAPLSSSEAGPARARAPPSQPQHGRTWADKRTTLGVDVKNAIQKREDETAKHPLTQKALRGLGRGLVRGAATGVPLLGAAVGAGARGLAHAAVVYAPVAGATAGYVAQGIGGAVAGTVRAAVEAAGANPTTRPPPRSS